MDDGTAATLEVDRTCVTCGYNLRGLSPAGLCPECATPVRQSLSGEPAEWSDARWVRRLKVGCLLIVGAQVPFVVGLSASRSDNTFLESPRGAGVPLGLLLCALGAWLISSPVAGLTQEPGFRRSCRWTRLLCLAPCAASLIPGNVFLAGMAVTWSACVFFTFDCLRRVARRARWRKLARWTAFVKWALPAGMLAPVGEAAVLEVLQPQSPYPGLIILSLTVLIGVLPAYAASLAVLCCVAARTYVAPHSVPIAAAPAPVRSGP